MKILDENNVLDLKVGEEVGVVDPKTGETVVCYLEKLHGYGSFPDKVFLTTKDSDVEKFNSYRGGNMGYADFIKHLRQGDGYRAAMPMADLVELLKTKNYRIG